LPSQRSPRLATHPLAEAEALYQFTDFTGFIDAFKAVTRRLIGLKTTSSPPGA